MTLKSGECDVAIVTASDSRYFGLLQGLLDSLDDSRVPSTWARCVLDVGLTFDQRKLLEKREVVISNHDWCLDFPGRAAWDAEKRWFKAMVNRPFLPELFPGFGAYLWVDSDAWVQDAVCLESMVCAAIQHDALAIVFQEFGRSVRIQADKADGEQRVIEISEASIRANIGCCYECCFGVGTNHYASGLITNSGVFAITKNSSVWMVWREYLARGLRNGVNHTLVEQQALNLACLENAVRYVGMPSRCNWNLTTLQPAWNSAIGSLVDPREPNSRIGVIHYTDVKHCVSLPVYDLNGALLTLPIAYGDFKSWRAAMHRSTNSNGTDEVDPDCRVP